MGRVSPKHNSTKSYQRATKKVGSFVKLGDEAALERSQNKGSTKEGPVRSPHRASKGSTTQTHAKTKSFANIQGIVKENVGLYNNSKKTVTTPDRTKESHNHRGHQLAQEVGVLDRVKGHVDQFNSGVKPKAYTARDRKSG